MAIKVTFGRPRGEPVLFGPFERMVFEGGRLRTDADRTIAVHVDHNWKVGDERYSRLDIAGPVCVALSRGASRKTYGPFTAFSCVDGVAYAEGHVFAFVDAELGDWYCVEDSHHWKSLEVQPPEKP